MSWIVCWIKFAAPVRDLFIIYSVRKDVDMTRVLMLPSKMRNCLRERVVISELIIAD